MGKYFTEKERYLLEYLYNKERKTQREIAVIMNKHYNTIYNEIKRGTIKLLNSDLSERSEYCADVAQDKYNYNCTAKGAKLKISNDYDYSLFIEDCIKNHYSFYSAKILADNQDFNTCVCLTTLYSYYHSGVFNLSKNDLPYNKTKKAKQEKQGKKIYKFGKKLIDERIDISDRDIYGHWEMDTVQGKQSSNTCLLVLTERKSRQELVFKLDNKQCCSVWSTLEKYWDILKNYVKTITCDNGVEFSTNYDFKNDELKEFVRTNLYYCHPYRSSERGTNENQNKIIRRFIPKGVDIAPFTDDFILKIQNFINNMPRKIFNGLSTNQFLKLHETEYLII